MNQKWIMAFVLLCASTSAFAVSSSEAQRLATQAVGGGLVYDVEQADNGFLVVIDHQGRRYEIVVDGAGKVVSKKAS